MFKAMHDWVGDRTAAQVWADCPRADWLLWHAARAGVDRRLLVGAAAAVARDVLPIFEAARSDSRVRDCLDACDRYAAGEDVYLVPYRHAAYDAANSAAFADLSAAADAGYSAAFAAFVSFAHDAAPAADYAADYAYYAAYAADAAARARHAEIVRSKISIDQIKAHL